MASLPTPAALALGAPGPADLAASIERVSAALRELGDTVAALQRATSSSPSPASLKRPRSASDLAEGRAAKLAALQAADTPAAAALAGIGAAAGASAARALAAALAAAAALGPAPVPAGPLARAVAAATHAPGVATPPGGGSGDAPTGTPATSSDGGAAGTDAAAVPAATRPRRAAAQAPPLWRASPDAAGRPPLARAAATATPSRSTSGMDGLLDAIDELDRREAAAAAAAAGGPPPPPPAGDASPLSAATIARAGSWTDADKAALIKLATEAAPRGAAGWAAIAAQLGRGPAAGASAERMFRTLADPGYARASSSHGRRLGPRTGTPMAVMAAAALATLPGRRGNLAQIADAIQATPEYAPLLDWSPRPGTKTYPRWKDALVGCFKAGRYPHLAKTGRKDGGLNVYALVPPLPAAAEAAIAKVVAAAANGAPDAPQPAATAESPAAARAPRSPPSPESHASAPAAHAASAVEAPKPPSGVVTVTAHVTAARPGAAA